MAAQCAWCALAVRDLTVSTRYYIDVLGFTRDPIEADGWSFLSRDNALGLREFGLATPDGHRITCGEPMRKR